MTMISPPAAAGLWSLADARALSGASGKQIDYWAREGLLTYAIPAAGSGSRRGFSELDVLRLRAMSIASDGLTGPNPGARPGVLSMIADVVMDATAEELQGPLTIDLDDRVSVVVELGGWSRVAAVSGVRP